MKGWVSRGLLRSGNRLGPDGKGFAYARRHVLDLGFAGIEGEQPGMQRSSEMGRFKIGSRNSISISRRSGPLAVRGPHHSMRPATDPRVAVSIGTSAADLQATAARRRNQRGDDPWLPPADQVEFASKVLAAKPVEVCVQAPQQPLQAVHGVPGQELAADLGNEVGLSGPSRIAAVRKRVTFVHFPACRSLSPVHTFGPSLTERMVLPPPPAERVAFFSSVCVCISRRKRRPGART